MKFRQQTSVRLVRTDCNLPDDDPGIVDRGLGFIKKLLSILGDDGNVFVIQFEIEVLQLKFV